MIFEKPYIAIDVGTHSVKAMEMAAPGSSIVKHAAIAPIPRETFLEGSLNDSDALKLAVERMFHENKWSWKKKRFSFAIGGDQVLIKKVWMPLTTRSQMEMQIEAEAKQNFHADMDELYWRYHLSLEDINHKGDVPVYLVAADRSYVDERMDIIKDLGGKIGLVDIEAFCYLNVFVQYTRPGNALAIVLDVGHSHTKFTVIQNSTYLYSREFVFGGKEYTEALMEQLELDYATAEQVKIETCQNPSSAMPEILTAIADVNDRIVDQFRSAIDDFRHIDPSYQTLPIEGIAMLGGGSATYGLAGSISATLETSARVFNPLASCNWKKAKVAGSIVQPQAHRFGTLMALAQRKTGDESDLGGVAA